MKTLSHDNEFGKLISKYLNDPGSFNDYVRDLAELFLNDLFKILAEEYCKENNCSRNGYRSRNLNTGIGTLHLQIPKVRKGTFFPDQVLYKYSRTEKALISVANDLYVRGLSTRKLSKHLESLGIENISPSTVSRLNEQLDAYVEELNNSDLSQEKYPYLFLDATFVKCRNEHKICSTANISAIGITEDGYRVLLGVSSYDSETGDAWDDFLKTLKKRGLRGVKLVISDAFEGLKNSIDRNFIGCEWQRCIVHMMRNVMAKATSRHQRRIIGALISKIFDEEDPERVIALYEETVNKIGCLNERAAQTLEDAKFDCLTYLKYPKAHHRKIRTNNIQERTNRELKRRTNVVSIFPSQSAMIRLVSSVYLEINEEWQCRKWIGSMDLLEFNKGFDLSGIKVRSDIRELMRDAVDLTYRENKTKRAA